MASLLPLLLSTLLAACAAPLCQPEAGDSLPVTLSSGLPVVPVETNGRRLPFLLDTGASVTVLRQEGAAALGLPVDRLRGTTIRGVGGDSRLSNALLARMQVGSRMLRNLTLPVSQHGDPDHFRFAGTIGADLLRVSALELDIPGSRIALHDAPGCATSPPPWPLQASIPVRILPSGLVLIPATLNGRATHALFDTGAARSVLRADRIADYGIPPEATQGRPAGYAIGAGPGRVDFHIHRGTTLEIGGETIADMPIVLSSLPPTLPVDLVIGQDYIGARRLWLSYAGRRLDVAASAGR
ncbi:retroviral-like aspartic protease family protein [Roseomonas harenae]|uniref:retroviral-like aspartic protease family protein n=1 Tax=Muricoccus harenae TaxID=2692566 RepID=UPI0013317D88|nr:retroviral-like aspartic protease family protein [Roseomonas harenae]